MIKLFIILLNLLALGAVVVTEKSEELNPMEDPIIELRTVDPAKVPTITNGYVGAGANKADDGAGKYIPAKPELPAVDYIDGEKPDPKPIEVVKDDGKSGTGNGEFVLED